ncbi:haloacid dehalogenase type II [Streptomyces sulphureus]|uniref:haloacid dehalogenase type II n=1 Tax=Streptomyces sulphureus TaxID=47758 RepID=UPI00035D0A27|nr:haloacid dehalogenase type II [Streptomyces sulphureus]
MEPRPVVAFDLLETVLDLAPLRDRFSSAGLPAELVHPWFLRVQRDSMALVLAGGSPEFRRVARQALRTESGRAVPDEQADGLLDAFRTLPAHPDAEPALRRLTDAGFAVAGLTVGEAASTREALDRAGLAPFVDRIVTARQVGSWKPAPAVYHAAAEAMETTPERMAVVAVHAWDCHGATRAGCPTGWCSRLEGEFGEVFAPPDVTGGDLVRVADGLVDLLVA